MPRQPASRPAPKALQTKAAGQPAPAATLSRQLAQRITRLSRKDPARVYTPADFLDLGTPHAVGMALSRMVRAGTLRRVARGLYDVPRQHPLLGELSPSIDALVQAVARRDGVVVQPLDLEATNLLGLSEQVVAQPVYETNGPSRTLRVAGAEIQFRHRAPRRVTAAAESSNLVFAALRGLGKVHVTLERVAHLQRMLPTAQRKQLLKDLPLAPAWMHPFLRHIASGEQAAPTPAQPEAPAMSNIAASEASSHEMGLQAVHRQWALWSMRRFRLTHPELIITLYGVDWNFTIHVANCDDESFPNLAEYFDQYVRPMTCNIKLSQHIPSADTLIAETGAYEAELWLNGEPLPAPALNDLLLLAEPRLPNGAIDFDNKRNTWIFRTFTPLTDIEKVCIQKAAARVGIIDSVDVVVVSPPSEAQPARTSNPSRGDALSITPSRRLKNAPDSLRNLVERDEDEWRAFLSRRSKQVIVESDTDTAQNFACLYDVEHCGDSRLSELLTLYDRVDVMPAVRGGLEWCSKHLASLPDLQELVRLKRVRFILPYSIENYPSSLLEAIAEVDHSSIVLSRTLATKTIIRGQTKDPLLYAPLTSSQRAAILSALSQSVTDKRYLELLKSYGQLFSGQHDLFMMRGALASLGCGVGAYLGDVFLKLGNKDARLELATCGAGIEWALGLGASYIPRDYGGHDETWNSQIVASYLGRTKLRQTDPVANRMHIVSDGLLGVSGVPPLAVAQNFHSLPASRFRNLARRLMIASPDASELQSAIDLINADVRNFESRVERLAPWRLESLFTGVAVAAVSDSLNMGVAASAISSWLYGILEQKIPPQIRNEFADAKHMLTSLATGSTLDAVVVSRSRKALTQK